jgi:hypothetical protein
MKTKIFLSLIFVIFLISIVTLILVLNFMDPYSNRTVSVITAGISFVLSVSTFFTFIIYFFKKIYFRWEVFLVHLFASFRQSFFLASFLLAILIFLPMWILTWLTWGLLLIIFLFIELLIQNME